MYIHIHLIDNLVFHGWNISIHIYVYVCIVVMMNLAMYIRSFQFEIDNRKKKQIGFTCPVQELKPLIIRMNCMKHHLKIRASTINLFAPFAFS